MSATLYNILTLDFSILFANLNFSCNVHSNAVAIRVSGTLNTIFDPLTKAVNITFSDILQLSPMVIVLH